MNFECKRHLICPKKSVLICYAFLLKTSFVQKYSSGPLTLMKIQIWIIPDIYMHRSFMSFIILLLCGFIKALSHTGKINIKLNLYHLNPQRCYNVSAVCCVASHQMDETERFRTAAC